jgi:PelA/Pel-15E family pectate lyase
MKMRFPVRVALVGAAWLTVGCAPMRAQTADSMARLGANTTERDTTPLLGDARIAALPAEQRAAWQAYVARSRALRAADQASMAAELKAVGLEKMTRAPYVHDFEVLPSMTPHWFAGDSAQRMAGVILSFQTPSGGWSKHVDFTKQPRQPGQSYFSETAEWQYIATIDNSSTTEEMRFLALADSARPDARYRDAFVRGLGYLHAAQFPNGCWPQVYPLQGGYHDAATFNDDAILNVVALLRDVGDGRYAFVPEAERAAARASVDRAVGCIVASQAREGGKLTVWGQQHDPLTLEPTSARRYELTSLTAQESADLLRFLMSLPDPNPRVVTAVHAAVDWLKHNAVEGYSYENQVLTPRPGAPPLWARMYEIGSNRPIFSNRDAVKLYDWNQLTDRRTGYNWFTTAPAGVISRYARWAARHPLPVTAAR